MFWDPFKALVSVLIDIIDDHYKKWADQLSSSSMPSREYTYSPMSTEAAAEFVLVQLDANAAMHL